jgi:hypothetical protein
MFKIIFSLMTLICVHSFAATSIHCKGSQGSSVLFQHRITSLLKHHSLEMLGVGLNGRPQEVRNPAWIPGVNATCMWGEVSYNEATQELNFHCRVEGQQLVGGDAVKGVYLAQGHLKVQLDSRKNISAIDAGQSSVNLFWRTRADGNSPIAENMSCELL